MFFVLSLVKIRSAIDDSSRGESANTTAAIDSELSLVQLVVAEEAKASPQNSLVQIVSSSLLLALLVTLVAALVVALRLRRAARHRFTVATIVAPSHDPPHAVAALGSRRRRSQSAPAFRRRSRSPSIVEWALDVEELRAQNDDRLPSPPLATRRVSAEESGRLFTTFAFESRSRPL